MKPAIDLISENRCTGCYGCFNACIENAIDMRLNEEGFLIPHVDPEKCVKCGICQKHCPIINTQLTRNFASPILFAAWSKDEEIRIQSSSGGIFTEIAKVILKDGGVVFGAAFDNSLRVRHFSIENEENLRILRGSKYVQSDVDNAYQRAISIAMQGRPVLFCGTPCQIASLNTFFDPTDFKIEIYTSDVICHGVPSEFVFMSYLEYISRSEHLEIKEFRFRDKTIGWKHYGTRIIFSNGEEWFQVHKRDPFMIGYLKNIYLRLICYECPFAKIPRISDITLGDFWGVPKELDDPRGVSVVIVNTPKGKKLFDKVFGIEKIPVSLKQVAPYNPRLVSGHLERKLNREDFYNLLKMQGFQVAMKKYLKPHRKFKEYLSAVKFRFSKIIKKVHSKKYYFSCTRGEESF